MFSPEEFRLHIDIPLGTDEEVAIKLAKSIIQWCFSDEEAQNRIMNISPQVENINYRLGHDWDRQKSNYLDKNENDHVSNKKCRLTISKNSV
jgi:hypothetical protein